MIRTKRIDEEIMQAVSRASGIHPDRILARCHYPEVSMARQVYAYLLEYEAEMKHEQIGKRIGRDRSTIWYGVKRISDLIAVGDEETVNLIKKCRHLLVSYTKGGVFVESSGQGEGG